MVTTLKKQHVWRADKTIQPAYMRLKVETHFSVSEEPKHRIKMSARCGLTTVGPIHCFCSPEELYHSAGTVRQAEDRGQPGGQDWTLDPWHACQAEGHSSTLSPSFSNCILLHCWISILVFALSPPTSPTHPTFCVSLISSVSLCFRIPIEQRAGYQPNREGGYMFVCTESVLPF